MGTLAVQLIDAHLTVGEAGSRHRVFAGLSLDVERNELLCVVGPSGTGKSTLLSVLAGLRPLDHGRVEVFDHPTRPAAPAIVFQHPHLLPWRRVVDNVILGLEYRRHRHLHSGERARIGRRRDRRAAATELLERLGIRELADRYPAELSGGQAQRAAIARAVVTRPSLLLLDEPFSALDAGTRSDLQRWLTGLTDELDLTTVLVTHDVDEAVRVGQRIGVLNGPHDLYLIANPDRRGVGAEHDRVRADVLGRLGADPLTQVVDGDISTAPPRRRSFRPVRPDPSFS